jgi:putative ABC transport system permease protein
MVTAKMHFITLIFRNVTRRRVRTGLTLCALSTAVAAVVALVGVSNGFTRSFGDVYRAHGVDLVVSRKGAADRLSSGISASSTEAIRQIDGVRDTAGLLLETMSLEQEGIYGLPTIGIQSDAWLLQDYRLTQGRALRDDDQKVVMLGAQLALRLKEQTGGTILFFEDESFEVIGVFESYSTWENSSVIMPLDQLQRLTDRPSQVTYVNVVLENRTSQQDMSRVIAAIESMDDRLLAMPTEEFVQTDTRMRLAKAMAWMTSSIALLIGAIGLFNTMMASIYERTREIGVLRAIGWKQGRVVRMILAEASLLSVMAAAIGSVAGVFLIWGMSLAPAVAGTISPSVDWRVITQGFVIAVIIGLLGAAYPAYRAASLVPTEALRHE